MHAPSEPLSPFVPWSSEDRAPLHEAEASTPAADRQPLLVDLLRDPAAITERLLDAVAAPGPGARLGGHHRRVHELLRRGGQRRPGKEAWWGSAALTSLNVLMSLAASLGPIYATSILLAARVPLARLVAALLAAAATGSLLLAGLASPLYLLTRLNPEWAGPLMLTSSFLLAGAAAGARIHRLLSHMAETVTGKALGDAAVKLGQEDAFRVGILARISWMMLAFTLALGFWAFNALG